MKNRRGLLNVLALLSLPLFFAPAAYAQANDGCDKRGEQSVILYDQPGFRGQERHLGVGGCRLFNFNDQASSIKVPKDMVAVVYEHADEGGGFGEWVDFLEDQPDLSTYRFDKKISYLEVFPLRRGASVYARNKIENGRFVQGHWVPAGGSSGSSDPVVAPFKPANVPEITLFEAQPTLINQGQSTTLRWQTANAEMVRIGERHPGGGQDAGPQSINWLEFVHPSGTSQKNPARPTVYVLEAKKGDKVTSKNVLVDIRRAPPSFCSISGRIIGNRPSYGTWVELRRADNNQVVQRERVGGIVFRFERVPVGTYRIVPRGQFPSEGERPSSLWYFPRSDGVTCRPNGSFSLQFRIHNTEG